MESIIYITGFKHDVQYLLSAIFRIIKLSLKFKLRSYRLNAEGKKVAPECFIIHGKVKLPLNDLYSWQGEIQ